MKTTKVTLVEMVAAALVIGCVAGGLFFACKTSQPDSHVAKEPATNEQTQPMANNLEPTTDKTPSSAGRSVIINGQRLSGRDIETIEKTFQVQVRDGDYWYDRMNGSWGQKGGPTEGFIIAGLNLGGPLRENASNGNTGVFINGRQLHRVDVARLSLLGPVNQGRCWMDAQGNIGLEGQPAFANIWVAAKALSGGSRKEGILSSYDKTGIAVIGGEVLIH
jgi:hypothetical protein